MNSLRCSLWWLPGVRRVRELRDYLFATHIGVHGTFVLAFTCPFGGALSSWELPASLTTSSEAPGEQVLGDFATLGAKPGDPHLGLSALLGLTGALYALERHPHNTTYTAQV